VGCSDETTRPGRVFLVGYKGASPLKHFPEGHEGMKEKQEKTTYLPTSYRLFVSFFEIF
jgi:hypothetical protein